MRKVKIVMEDVINGYPVDERELAAVAKCFYFQVENTIAGLCRDEKQKAPGTRAMLDMYPEEFLLQVEVKEIDYAENGGMWDGR